MTICWVSWASIPPRGRGRDGADHPGLHQLPPGRRAGRVLRRGDRRGPAGYWIYWEVGKELRRRGSPDPRFQRWIDTYSGADYGEYVQEVLDLTNRLGGGLAEAERARLHWYFRASSRYEWMFWDMGYRMESWPVPV